jgi:hypothetical protein
MSGADARRKTAAEIARGRVLAAYGKKPGNFTVDLPSDDGFLSVTRGKVDMGGGSAPAKPLTRTERAIENAIEDSFAEKATD